MAAVKKILNYSKAILDKREPQWIKIKNKRIVKILTSPGTDS